MSHDKIQKYVEIKDCAGIGCIFFPFFRFELFHNRNIVMKPTGSSRDEFPFLQNELIFKTFRHISIHSLKKVISF